MGRDSINREQFHKSKEEHNRDIRILGLGTDFHKLIHDLSLSEKIVATAFFPESKRKSARKKMRNSQGIFLKKTHPSHDEEKVKSFKKLEQELKEKISLYKHDKASDRLIQLVQDYSSSLAGSGQFHLLIRCIAERFYFVKPKIDSCVHVSTGKSGTYFAKIS